MYGLHVAYTWEGTLRNVLCSWHCSESHITTGIINGQNIRAARDTFLYLAWRKYTMYYDVVVANRESTVYRVSWRYFLASTNLKHCSLLVYVWIHRLLHIEFVLRVHHTNGRWRYMAVHIRDGHSWTKYCYHLHGRTLAWLIHRRTSIMEKNSTC